MPLTLNSPPTTPVEPVTDVLHSVSITDPYRWLEDQNSQRTRKWLEEQTAYTRAYLDAITGRDRIRRRVEKLLAVETISDPWKVGNRYFYLKRAPHAQQPAIAMRDDDNNNEVILIDPGEKDTCGASALSILNVSRDGNLLALAVREGGEDSCSIEFFDVLRRERLEDRLEHGFFRGLAFSGDGQGFYYSHETIGSNGPPIVSYHTFGQSKEQDKDEFVGGHSPKRQLFLLASPCTRRLGYFQTSKGDAISIEFLVHDIATNTPPKLVVKQMQGLFVPYLLDDALFALTDWNAPNCRFVMIDINRPEPDSWRDVVPECDSRILRAVLAGGFVFVTYSRNLSTVIQMFSLSGKNMGTIPLPTIGTAFIFVSRPENDTIFIKFSSFVHPPSILCHHIPTGKQKTWTRTKIDFPRSPIKFERIAYPSKDRTVIPMFLVSKRDPRATGPLHTFLTAYGGFGKSITPHFTAYGTYLIERGCLLAIANIRGGSEFGEAWHMAAKRTKRQTAIDDFVSAAEWLIREGHTVQGKLAIGGGSNGGLLVAAALTQRPDLFRAVVCLGPLLDMLRYHLFDFADDWIDEYGSVETETDFKALLDYSPYHKVEAGAAYPAVLLISGDADTRCNPLHARKMTARLQGATTSNHPILLDYKREWGHTPVQPLTRRIDALTDRLAFLCRELGLDP